MDKYIDVHYEGFDEFKVFNLDGLFEFPLCTEGK